MNASTTVRAAPNGGALVRLFYIDESGRSSLEKDPHFVVAGLGVHGDTQYHPLVSRIASIRDECFPNGAPDGFYFHATELYSGGGFFPRETWPREKRHEVLAKLASVPREFNLPVFLSSLDRKALRGKSFEGLARMFLDIEHCICLTFIEVLMEKWLVKFAANELAMIVAEDIPETKKHLKKVHADLRQSEAISDPRFNGTEGNIPLKNIVDTLNFAGKDGAPLLQLADICAFYGKKWLSNDDRAKVILSPLDDQIVEWAQWSPS
jgi:hypothetical protein